MQQYTLSPIGSVHADGEQFSIEIAPEYRKGLQALEGFSHLNVYWWFSENDRPELRQMIEMPSPYKGSPDVMGVFATRSPIRPNPIAMTVVRILHIDHESGVIEIDYTDAFDGTPVLDLKPYTPSADRVEAPEVPNWCAHWPKRLEDGGDFDWESVFNF